MRTLFSTLFLLLVAAGTGFAQQKDNPETPFHDQQVALLKKGAKYFNAYQKAYKEKNGKMPALNFQEAPLAGMDLRGMNFENANFQEADLRGVKFGTKPSKRVKKYDNEDRLIDGKPPIPSANLKGANLSGADLGEDGHNVADLSLANMENVNLSEADLTGAKLVKTNLRRANLTGTSLIGCNLRKADLTLADISEADVENCTFDRTILIKTKMEGVNVDEAKMEEVILNEKDLELYKKKEEKAQNGF